MTNFCIYDCAYCINRVSSNVPRARFTPDEVVKLTVEFYRRNYIEGLFLSSGIIRSPDATMSDMVIFEKASVFAFRSLHLPCWRIGFFTNPFLLAALTVTIGAQVAAVYWPPLQALLHTVPLQGDQWMLIGLLVLPILLVPEILKTLRYFASRRQQGRAVAQA